MGGGLAASAMQVGAQASVPHVDVAMVTATVLLVTEIGGAMGGAIGKKNMFSPFFFMLTVIRSRCCVVKYYANEPGKIFALLK